MVIIVDSVDHYETMTVNWVDGYYAFMMLDDNMAVVWIILLQNS